MSAAAWKLIVIVLIVVFWFTVALVAFCSAQTFVYPGRTGGPTVIMPPGQAPTFVYPGVNGGPAVVLTPPAPAPLLTIPSVPLVPSVPSYTPYGGY